MLAVLMCLYLGIICAALPKQARAIEFTTEQSLVTSTALTPLVEATPTYDWYVAGGGATGTFFTVSNAAQLLGLANIANGTALPYPQNSFQGATVTLGGIQINMGSVADWTPIGTADHPFEGSFNGANRTITNMTITSTTSNAGLFGVTGEHAAIRDVKLLESCRIQLGTAEAPLGAGEATPVVVSNVGSVVGLSQGSVTGCTSAAPISIYNATTATETAPETVKYVGGIVGRTDASIDTLSYTGSVYAFLKTGAAEYSVTPADNRDTYIIGAGIGGVVGFFGDLSATPGGTSATIEGCSNSGSVTVITEGVAENDRFGSGVVTQVGYVGGIAGYSTGSIVDCSNAGAVDSHYMVTNFDGSTSTTAAAAYTGGIVGSMRGNILTDMTVEGKGVTVFDAGTYAKDNPIEIADCANTGAVFGNHCGGGIAGQIGWYSAAKACYNTGAVEVARWNKPQGGGIAGQSYGTVAYCYNRGTVRSTTNAGYYAAGIIGAIFMGTSTDTTTAPTPEVYGCYNTGRVYGSLRAGAIAGQNEGYVHDCYSLKGVVYIDANNNSDENQSLIPNNYATMKNCAFYTADELKASTAVAALNQMAASEGWESYYVSAADAATNSGYPQLTWERGGEDPTTLIDLSNPSATVIVERVDDALFTGAASVPTLKVTYNGKELVQNADYRVVVDVANIARTLDKDEQGTRPYTAHIAGMGNYTGTPSATTSYGIVIADLASCTVVITPQVYMGLPLTVAPADVVVRGVSNNVVVADDYSYEVNEGKDCIDRRIYKVVITAKDTAQNYYGSVEGEFIITPANIYTSTFITSVSTPGAVIINATSSNTTFAQSSDPLCFTYTGEPILPAVDRLLFGTRELIEGEEYDMVYYPTTYDYVNVTPEGTALKFTMEAHNASVGNFNNYDDMFFTIAPANISAAIITAPDQKHSGSPRCPVMATFNNKLLVEGSYDAETGTWSGDYWVEYSNNVNPGVASYTVHGVNNFTGTYSGSFDISDEEARDINNCTISAIEDQGWTSKALTPDPDITDGAKTLRRGYDYLVVYSNNTDANVGTAAAADAMQPAVIVTGIGDYKGSLTGEFDIVANKVSLSSAFNDDVWTIRNIDGTAIKKPSGTTVPTVAKGLDETVEVYIKRGDAGTAYLSYDLQNIKVTGLTTGTVYPATVVSLNTPTPVSGISTGTFTFEMPDEDVVITEVCSNFTVSGVEDNYVTSGNAVAVVPVVKNGLKTLVVGTDYMVTYKNAAGTEVAAADLKAVGSYTVTIAGTGSYGIKPTGYFGSITKGFTISTAPLKDFTIDDIPSLEYTGQTLVPQVVAKDGETVLTTPDDYTVSYKDASGAPVAAPDLKAVGNYTAVVTGCGNYTGTLEKAFAIVQPQIAPVLAYDAHVQNKGWMGYVGSGQTAGTFGESLRVEALRIRLIGEGVDENSIQANAHVQNEGWMGWVGNDGLCGTEGRALRVEAFQIELSDKLSDAGYSIWYRVHAQNVGWMGWAHDGAQAGTAGLALRLEAVQVVLVGPGEDAPENDGLTNEAHPFIDSNLEGGDVAYDAMVHIQDAGNTDFLGEDGSGYIGTVGSSKRLEGLELSLDVPQDSGLSIRYKTHIQDYGWEEAWASDGEFSGTHGESKRLEAVCVELVGDDAAAYEVYYRTHVQNIGWTGWAKDGQACGSAGFGYRMEAMQIMIVPKGGTAPGINSGYFHEKA